MEAQWIVLVLLVHWYGSSNAFQPSVGVVWHPNKPSVVDQEGGSLTWTNHHNNHKYIRQKTCHGASVAHGSKSQESADMNNAKTRPKFWEDTSAKTAETVLARLPKQWAAVRQEERQRQAETTTKSIPRQWAAMRAFASHPEPEKDVPSGRAQDSHSATGHEFPYGGAEHLPAYRAKNPSLPTERNDQYDDLWVDEEMTTASQSLDELFMTDNMMYPVPEEPKATVAHGTIPDSADASIGEETSSNAAFMNADSSKPSWIVDEEDGVIVWLPEDDMEKVTENRPQHHLETPADQVATKVQVGWSPGGAANDRHDIAVESTRVHSQRDVERSPLSFQKKKSLTATPSVSGTIHSWHDKVRSPRTIRKTVPRWSSNMKPQEISAFPEGHVGPTDENTYPIHTKREFAEGNVRPTQNTYPIPLKSTITRRLSLMDRESPMEGHPSIVVVHAVEPEDTSSWPAPTRGFRYRQVAVSSEDEHPLKVGPDYQDQEKNIVSATKQVTPSNDDERPLKVGPDYQDNPAIGARRQITVSNDDERPLKVGPDYQHYENGTSARLQVPVRNDDERPLQVGPDYQERETVSKARMQDAESNNDEQPLKVGPDYQGNDNVTGARMQVPESNNDEQPLKVGPDYQGNDNVTGARVNVPVSNDDERPLKVGPDYKDHENITGARMQVLESNSDEQPLKVGPDYQDHENITGTKMEVPESNNDEQPLKVGPDYQDHENITGAKMQVPESNNDEQPLKVGPDYQDHENITGAKMQVPESNNDEQPLKVGPDYQDEDNNFLRAKLEAALSNDDERPLKVGPDYQDQDNITGAKLEVPVSNDDERPLKVGPDYQDQDNITGAKLEVPVSNDDERPLKVGPDYQDQDNITGAKLEVPVSNDDERPLKVGPDYQDEDNNFLRAKLEAAFSNDDERPLKVGPDYQDDEYISGLSWKLPVSNDDQKPLKVGPDYHEDDISFVPDRLEVASSNDDERPLKVGADFQDHDHDDISGATWQVPESNDDERPLKVGPDYHEDDKNFVRARLEAASSNDDERPLKVGPDYHDHDDIGGATWQVPESNDDQRPLKVGPVYQDDDKNFVCARLEAASSNDDGRPLKVGPDYQDHDDIGGASWQVSESNDDERPLKVGPVHLDGDKNFVRARFQAAWSNDDERPLKVGPDYENGPVVGTRLKTALSNDDEQPLKVGPDYQQDDKNLLRSKLKAAFSNDDEHPLKVDPDYQQDDKNLLRSKLKAALSNDDKRPLKVGPDYQNDRVAGARLQTPPSNDDERPLKVGPDYQNDRVTMDKIASIRHGSLRFREKTSGRVRNQREMDSTVAVLQAAPSITEAQVRSLFDHWNDALATLNSTTVANCYAVEPILLPTVSDEPRTDFQSIKEYFDTFLKLEPQGVIMDGKINIGPGWAQDAGIYEFTMGATGTKVKARYSFLYVYEGGEWKIAHHHSSTMPESLEKTQITSEECKGLFDLWNNALATCKFDAFGFSQ